MTTDEKIKLLNDVRAVKGPLSTVLWDKGRKPGDVPENIHDSFQQAYFGLIMLELRLVAEIGTDNL